MRPNTTRPWQGGICVPTAASDDGVVLGLKFDISRVKQTLDQVKNMVQGLSLIHI